MQQFSVTNLGQIKKADITFGDLTLLVGPQATGKSILLQSIKLAIDSGYIVNNIKANGYEWESEPGNQNENIGNFIDFYFGEGMRSIWGKETNCCLDRQSINIADLLKSKIEPKEKLFYMPAQRVLTLENGWPRSFLSFEIGDPYVVRNFSEHLRLLMQKDWGNQGSPIFPQKGLLKQYLTETLERSIFHGAQVKITTIRMRKRILLNLQGNALSFMAWSAGQREFMPLLLGFYWLMPKSPPWKKSNIDWVVIEEPEMGLHPEAILSVIMMCLELLHRGYRVIVSTHSPVLLEVVWAIRCFQEENYQSEYFYKLFDVNESSELTRLFDDIVKNKQFLTYYFQQEKTGVVVRDISSLDPFATDSAIANWGGLTSFSSQVSDVVSQAIQEKA